MADDDLIHELSAAYALDALSPDEERTFEAHLASCSRCRDEVANLVRSANALAYAAPLAEPPVELRARILSAARADRPNVVPLRPRRLRGTPTLALVAAVAAAAAVGFGTWAAVLDHRTTAAARELQLRGASGVVVRDAGGSATLVVAGLRPAPAGKTYEAWVIAGGHAEAAGLLPARSGGVLRLTRPVPVGSVVAVTLERQGGVLQPSGKPLATSEPA